MGPPAGLAAARHAGAQHPEPEGGLVRAGRAGRAASGPGGVLEAPAEREPRREDADAAPQDEVAEARRALARGASRGAACAAAAFLAASAGGCSRGLAEDFVDLGHSCCSFALAAAACTTARLSPEPRRPGRHSQGARSEATSGQTPPTSCAPASPACGRASGRGGSSTTLCSPSPTSRAWGLDPGCESGSAS
mmetsp:Transcript_115717/g.248646  ORF Transcript_115717/g.248646 Transcript_115717/m.248646 type:complete len:193 (-) Transcript_115717:322-900(-)